MSDNHTEVAVATQTQQATQTAQEAGFSLKGFLNLASSSQEERQVINSSNGLLNALQSNIDKINAVMDQLVDQVETQIAELKGRYRGLEHALPEVAFESSRITVLDLDHDSFLQDMMGDIEVIRTLTKVGGDMIANNCFAGLLTTRSLVGVYVDFPFGSNNPNQHEKEIRALTNMAELAHQNLSHVFFSVDPRQVMGKKLFSELPDDLNELTTEYQMSKFYKSLRAMDIRHQRRLCNTFNYFLADTERVSQRFNQDHRPSEDDVKLLDQAAWTSSVYAMMNQLTKNFDRFGWSHHIMGRNAIQEVPTYQNYQPVFHNRGLSFGANLTHRYALTLYDLIAPDDTTALVRLGFTPLQRQVLETKNSLEEYIAFTEAQTLIERDDDETSPNNFYNYLGNGLLEDAINRDLVLVLRQFIGSFGVSKKNEPRLKTEVEKLLQGLVQPRGEGRISKPLERFEIERCDIVGQTAKVKVKVLPLQVIRKVQIELDRIQNTNLNVEEDGGAQR